MYLAQIFWFSKAWRLSGPVRLPFKLLLRCLLGAAALILLATGIDPVFVRFLPVQGFTDWALAVSRAWLFASSLGLLAIVTVRLIAKLVTLLSSARGPKCGSTYGAIGRPNQGRRRFLRYGVFLAGSAPFMASAYGFASRLRFHVNEIEVPVAGLPPKLDGMRIAQISDIHIGDFMPFAQLRHAVEMTNRLHPDLTVITGDFISWKGDPLKDCISELSRLRAPMGVWGCNGNHEGYANAEHLSQVLFHRYGMRLLRSQNAVLERNGERLNLIGVDYQRQRDSSGTQPQMLAGIESLVRKDMPNILLSHNPNSFYRAAELGIELSLAGHTHGGQIQIDLAGDKLSPAVFYTKFVAGMYQLPFGKQKEYPSSPASGPFENKTVQPGKNKKPSAILYVNRGLGTIWIPVRLGVPPEITVFTLRRA